VTILLGGPGGTMLVIRRRMASLLFSKAKEYPRLETFA
jgi:hypothetical protein